MGILVAVAAVAGASLRVSFSVLRPAFVAGRLSPVLPAGLGTFRGSVSDARSAAPAILTTRHPHGQKRQHRVVVAGEGGATRDAAKRAASGEVEDGKGKGDPYREFLELAKREGVDEALVFFADSMPKKFCQNIADLRLAAEFVRSKAAGNESRRVPAETRRQPEPDASSMDASLDRVEEVGFTLKVCGKCIVRQQKKGDSSFSPLSALSSHFRAPGPVQVESTRCLKQCKKGPNVQVTTASGEAVAIAGMTPLEAQNKIFSRVADEAAAERVFHAMQQALQGPGQHNPAGEEASLVEAEAPVLRARSKRGRLRENIEARIADIVGDLA